ncbi:glycerophosphoryl diester phosphodiesterase membrane domain-containing protein [Patescibacteria group bacterium]|nr:glycerophosphoryl diester phosphodiesterase membrane domain-containing protein [Patescibacteria group bacterium]
METTQPEVIPAVPVATVMPGPIELIKRAYTDYRSRFHVISKVLAVSFLASVFQSIITFTLQDSLGLYLLASVLAFIVIYISYLALVIAVADEQNQHADISALYQSAWHVFFPYVGVFILTTLTVIAGLTLFVIPGIAVAIFLSFSMYVLVVEKKHWMSALTKSWYYVRGNWWKVFGRMIVFAILMGVLMIITEIVTSLLGLNQIGPRMFMDGYNGGEKEISLFASILSLAIQSFIVTPLGIFFFYLIYKSLREQKPIELQEVEEKKIRKNIYIIMGLGIVMSIIIVIVLGTLIVTLLPQIFPTPGAEEVNTTLSLL